MRLVESKNSFKSYYFILSLGGIGCMAVSYFLTQNVLNAPIVQIWPLMISGFFGIMGAWAIVSIYKLDALHIYQDRFEVISMFGGVKKTIYLREITSWIEIYKENKKDKWQELTIYTDTTKYKINSSFYDNYSSIKSLLIKGKRRDVEKETKYYRKLFLIYAIGTLLVGLAFLYGAYTSCFPNEINPNQLATITGAIANELKINEGRRSSRSVRIVLNHYPGYAFQLSGDSYRAAHPLDFVTDVEIGDTVMVDVYKEDYKDIMANEKNLGVNGKSLINRNIRVYGLKNNYDTYLTLEDYNEEEAHQREMGFWLMLVIGLGPTFGGLYFLLKMKR